MKATTPVGN